MAIDIQNKFQSKAIGKREARTLAREIVTALLAHYELPRKCGVGLLFVDDAEMTALNREHMGKDSTTDVLSFSFHEGMPPPGDPAPHLGDMIICVEEAARQAEARGHGIDAELRLLIVHGFLHLLGYDDTTPAARRKMNAETHAALAALNIEDVL
jgi:probable rRNA maturation factor